MPHITQATIVGLASLALWSVSTGLRADEIDDLVAVEPIAATEPAPTPVPSATLAGSQPVDLAELAGDRGGTNVTNIANDADLQGVVSNNNASNLTTGMNVVTEGSFTGTSGLTTVIQNSGNNNLFQNSVILNVQVK